MNSPHKGPTTRIAFSWYDVIMCYSRSRLPAVGYYTSRELSASRCEPRRRFPRYASCMREAYQEKSSLIDISRGKWGETYLSHIKRVTNTRVIMFTGCNAPTNTIKIFDTSRSEQNGHHYIDDSLEFLFSLKNIFGFKLFQFYYSVPPWVNGNKPIPGHVIAWCWPGDKPPPRPNDETVHWWMHRHVSGR